MAQWFDLKGEKGDTGDIGETGPSGADGRTPIHVADMEPTEDVLVGDLWFNPLTLKVQVCTSGT